MKGGFIVTLKLKLVIFITIMMCILSGCSSTPETSSPVAKSRVTKTKAPKPTTSVPNVPDTNQINGTLKAHFLDVGKADCILLQFPNNKNMLVDAGDNNDRDAIIEYLKNYNIKKLDWVVGTHPHKDHIGSMDAVISGFDIENVIMPKITTKTKTFEDVLLAVKAKDLKVKSPEPGNYLINEGGLSVQVLAPNGQGYEDLNNYSIVLIVKYLKNTFLLTGDAKIISEQEIMAKGFDIKADVLKVGHHGSDSSTSIEFLKKVNPKYAVISVGKGNSYRHSLLETISKLTSNNVEILCTDKDGTVIITSNGNVLSVDKKAFPAK